MLIEVYKWIEKKENPETRPESPWVNGNLYYRAYTSLFPLPILVTFLIFYKKTPKKEQIKGGNRTCFVSQFEDTFHHDVQSLAQEHEKSSHIPLTIFTERMDTGDLLTSSISFPFY